VVRGRAFSFAEEANNSAAALSTSRRGCPCSLALPKTMASVGQACSHAVAIAPSWIGEFDFPLLCARVDALHAIGALFHHAAAAHSDFRIAQQLELRRFPILERRK